jgi:hypothetical protein
MKIEQGVYAGGWLAGALLGKRVVGASEEGSHAEHGSQVSGAEQGVYPCGSLAGAILDERDAGASEEVTHAEHGSQVSGAEQGIYAGGSLAGALIDKLDAGASGEGSQLKQHAARAEHGSQVYRLMRRLRIKFIPLFALFFLF